MGHIVEQGYKTYVATADIAKGVAVKVVAGKIVVATAATDAIIGTIAVAVKAGAAVDVRLRSCGGTLNIIAGGAITEGAAVTANATGLGIVTTTAGNQIIGYALEAVASGAVVELLPSTAKY